MIEIPYTLNQKHNTVHHFTHTHVYIQIHTHAINRNRLTASLCICTKFEMKLEDDHRKMYVVTYTNSVVVRYIVCLVCP